jgi:anthranilate phosphoribosyltransferase
MDGVQPPRPLTIRLARRDSWWESAEFSEPRAIHCRSVQWAWVVNSVDGVDEISTTDTKVSECRAGSVNTLYILTWACRRPGPALRQGCRENARIIKAVFAGTRGPARDVTLMNAGAGLYIAGQAGSVREGIERAASAVDSGDAAALLDRLVAASQAESVPQ